MSFLDALLRGLAIRQDGVPVRGRTALNVVGLTVEDDAGNDQTTLDLTALGIRGRAVVGILPTDKQILVWNAAGSQYELTYPSEATYDWGKWGDCVFVFDPADAALDNENNHDITSFVDSSPLWRLGVARNSEAGQGTGYAQLVASSADFNSYPCAVFNGSPYYYGVLNGERFFGDTYDYALPRYGATNSRVHDYTMFWAVRLDAQAAPGGSATPIDYPALLSAQGGGVGTYFNGGNVTALASCTNVGGSYVYGSASVPFAIGAKKVITQRYTGAFGGLTSRIEIRDGLGAWSTSAPFPPALPPSGPSNVQLTGVWQIGANGTPTPNRFFQGAIGYGVIYRASLPDYQCETNIKQLLGRFRW